MPPDNHNKISAHNFLAEVKQENCKWDFHPSKWKCHCNNNATQGKCENFLQLFRAQAKNNLYNCRKKKDKKRCFSTLLSFIVFRCHHCRCVDDSRRLFLTMFQMGKTKSNAKMENYWNLECNWVSNGFASRNIKWQRWERSLTERESERERGVVVKPTGACWSTSLLFFLSQLKWNQVEQKPAATAAAVGSTKDSSAVAKIIKKMFTICHLTFTDCIYEQGGREVGVQGGRHHNDNSNGNDAPKILQKFCWLEQELSNSWCAGKAD